MNKDYFYANLGNAIDAWDSRVVSRYVIAYDAAWDEYQKTADAQDKEDQARVELFATIIGIISSSVWVAAVADKAVRGSLMKMGLRTLGAKNTHAVLNLLLMMRHEPVVGFVVGQVVDKLHTFIDSKLAGSLARLRNNTAGSITATRPLGRAEQLRGVLKEQSIFMRDVYKQIIALPSLSQQESQFDLWSTVPFMNPPSNGIGPDVLSKKLLLGMYMQKVLDGDNFLTHFPPDTRIPPVRGPGIDLMPSDKSYPRPQTYSQTLGMYNTVEVDRPGAMFEEAADDAYKAVYNTNFYDTHLRFIRDTPIVREFWNSSQQGSVGELKKAEATLIRLSEETRPQQAALIPKLVAA